MKEILIYGIIMIAFIAFMVWAFWGVNDDPFVDDGIPYARVPDDCDGHGPSDEPPEDENFEQPASPQFRRFQFLDRLERTGHLEDDEKRELHDLRLRFGRMR